MLIKEYFKGQEIFLTGGSGFLGKALIEKIVRSCPGFSKIYVLLRPKKGKDTNDRLHEILQTSFFNRARNENPAGFKRIEAIAGDCSEIGLGIQKEDLKRIENVTIIYHSAASVRFDDPLRDAILLNTRGTWELLKIAENLKKLQVFLHVSTAFCNSEHPVIEERIYEPCADWRKSIKIAELISEETLDIFSLKYSDFKPNTYCFTKALAEQVINEYKDKLPVLIYRPAVVTSCLDDPYPGWIDNFNGPMGLLISSGIGINKYHHSKGDRLHPIIPIDVVVRGMILATYKMGLQNFKRESTRTNSLDVYNCSIDKISPIIMADLFETSRLEILKNPFEKTLWVPGGAFHTCPFLFYIKYFMLQLTLSLILDGLMRFSGRKPMIMKVQRRICCAVRALDVFVKNEWDFKIEKFFSLDKVVPTEEYDDFAFLEKSRNINFEAYCRQGIKGGKEYLLNENPECSPGARKRLEILKIANYTLATIFYLFLIRFLYKFICAWFVRVFN